MKKGEHTLTLAALGLVSIFGILAMITFNSQPTGQVMQQQSVYVTEDQGNLMVECENRAQEVIFLRYDGNYAVYCCTEDMIGQNECRFEHKILLTRTY